MFDLKVGDVYYKVLSKLNTFHRKKEVRMIDGEEWFRYELPIYTYEVNSYKILGILRKELEGEWDDTEMFELETQWHVRCIETNHNFVTDVDSIQYHDFFLDKDAALAHIEQKLAEDRERVRA